MWTRLLAVVVALLLVALLAYGLASDAPEDDIDQTLARFEPAAAPPFELPVLQPGTLGPRFSAALRPALADGRISLTELRGHPVVLNYWASWCLPCRTEAPILERGWKRRDALFVGLNMQDVTDDARSFMREFDISYLNIRDKSNGVATDWGVTGLPETFFLSKRGRVVAHVIGAISEAQLRKGVAAALSGRPSGSVEGGDRRSTR